MRPFYARAAAVTRARVGQAARMVNDEASAQPLRRSTLRRPHHQIRFEESR